MASALEGPARARRGRPPRLTREEILEAAGRFDVHELSLPKLAESLNITHAALYTYFSSKADLLRALAAKEMAHIVLPPRGDEPWQEWVADAAHVMREVLRQHRVITGEVPASFGVVLLPLTEAFVLTLLEAGLTAEEAHSGFLLFFSCCLGSAANAIYLDAHRPVSREVITEYFAERGHPAGSQIYDVVEAIAAYDVDEGFRRHLEVVIECLSRKRTPPSRVRQAR